MKRLLLWIGLMGVTLGGFANDPSLQPKQLKKNLTKDVQTFKEAFQPVPTGDQDLDRILGSFSDFATGWVDTILDYLPNQEIPIEPPRTLPKNSFSNKPKDTKAKTK